METFLDVGSLFTELNQTYSDIEFVYDPRITQDDGELGCLHDDVHIRPYVQTHVRACAIRSPSLILPLSDDVLGFDKVSLCFQSYLPSPFYSQPQEAYR